MEKQLTIKNNVLRYFFTKQQQQQKLHQDFENVIEKIPEVEIKMGGSHSFIYLN